jgi:hypothetical protein
VLDTTPRSVIFTDIFINPRSTEVFHYIVIFL